MSVFGQVWVFSAIAFVLGAFLAWVFLVRPARKQIRSLEERLVAREADLRRISEPALGAAGTAQTRTERGDPFSDADEALAGTDAYGAGAAVDVPDRPEPETSWLERDSLSGDYAGGYAAGGYADRADDFDLADRPDDLEIPADSGDRFAHDADYDAGYSDGYRAFADDRAGDGEYDGTGYDDPGHHDSGYSGIGYNDSVGDEEGRHVEGQDDPTRYVAALDRDADDRDADDRGVADDAPVSSVLDPDEMRSAPGGTDADADVAASEAESTRLIGPDEGPGGDSGGAPTTGASPGSSDDAGTDQAGSSTAGSDVAGSALHLGAPFQPVTSFDATTELPVGGLQDSGLQSDGLRGSDVQGSEVQGGLRESGLAGDDAVTGGQDTGAGDQAHPAERPGSLFEPTPIDDADDAEDPGAEPSEAGDTGTGDPATGEAGSGHAGVGTAAETGAPGSNGSEALPADPPAYAFGGPGAGPDEDAVESTNVLPKRTPRQRPPGGFDAPKPIQPSMRAITRREPDAATQSGSLFEPASPGESASSGPAAEPADAGQQTGQAPPESGQLTKFVTPTGQVPTGDDAMSGQLAVEETGAPQAGAGQGSLDRSDADHPAQAGTGQVGAAAAGADAGTADDADAESARPGPFGPGSAMPLPGGGSPSPEFTVKASVTALRYVTDASPQYPRMVAEVWFRSPADAERVGFRPLT